MQWEFMVALALAIPVILFPIALAQCLNIGDVYSTVKEARQKLAARKGMKKAAAIDGQGQDTAREACHR